MKTCSCGIRYNKLPLDAKKNDLGYWFDCSCKSTLYIPSIAVIKKDLEKHPDIAHLAITTWDDVDEMEKEENGREL